MRTRVGLIFATLALLASCSTTDSRLGTPIGCDTPEPARLILFAQAVPDSALIPCVDELPVGWGVESIGTRSDEAVIVFENGAYDANVLGTLSSDCPATGTESPTEQLSITEHRDPDGTFTFTFAGGCFVMDIPEQVSDQDARALLAALGFLSREELRSRTGWTL